ncbi:hypothetical protein Efla_001921 [Eimeria flavescens]
MTSAAGLAWRASIVVAANSAQPLLVDLARYHGAADPSCCFFILPVYAAMAVVGCLTCDTKQQLTASQWRRATLICLVDLAHQVLEKAGLVFAGSALYLIAASFSTVWIALLSLFLLGKQINAAQWFGICCITCGFCLRVTQVPPTRGNEELMGVALVTAAQILHGLAFVLNEKYMNDADSRIEGPQLVFMCGVVNTLGLLLWTCVWTLPRWEELVTNVRRERGGSLAVIVCCFLGLTVCSLLRSSVLWVLLKHMGAVSAGVLKAVRMAVLTVLTHCLFCSKVPSQCLSPLKASAASLAMLGVFVYSINSNEKKAKQQAEPPIRGKPLRCAEAESLVARGFTQRF